MASAFEYPEVFGFPPFFTLQPVAETRERQLGMWVDLVVAFQRHHRRTIVKVAEAAAAPPFVNAGIGRSLGADGVRAVLDEICRRGLGSWRGAGRSECLTTWRTFGAWADALGAWAAESAKEGAVCTVYELRAGDETDGEAFHGVDAGVIVEAARVLEARGRAVLIPGENEDETGIKFIAK